MDVTMTSDLTKSSSGPRMFRADVYSNWRTSIQLLTSWYWRPMASFLGELLLMFLTWPMPFFICFLFLMCGLASWAISTVCGMAGVAEVDVKALVRATTFQVAAAYCKLMHRQEIHGMANIPVVGPALLVYYHGPLPVDYWGLMSKIYLTRGRMVTSIADRCLMGTPGFTHFKKYLCMTDCNRQTTTSLLKAGHLVGVAPGGAWEGLFGDNTYPIMWRKREGFAQVAIDADVPIIPIFTENIREVSCYLPGRTPVLSHLWRHLYQLTKLPFIPMYGLFPVHLVTHIGPPILPPPGTTAPMLKNLVVVSMENLIRTYQTLPGSIMRAVNSRFQSTTPFRKSGFQLKEELKEKKENGFIDFTNLVNNSIE